MTFHYFCMRMADDVRRDLNDNLVDGVDFISLKPKERRRKRTCNVATDIDYSKCIICQNADLTGLNKMTEKIIPGLIVALRESTKSECTHHVGFLGN